MVCLRCALIRAQELRLTKTGFIGEHPHRAKDIVRPIRRDGDGAHYGSLPHALSIAMHIYSYTRDAEGVTRGNKDVFIIDSDSMVDLIVKFIHKQWPLHQPLLREIGCTLEEASAWTAAAVHYNVDWSGAIWAAAEVLQVITYIL